MATGRKIIVALSPETSRMLDVIRTKATPGVLSLSDGVRWAIRRMAEQVEDKQSPDRESLDVANGEDPSGL